jgi:hypothetical protein
MAMTYISARFGIFDPEVLHGLQTALECTAPADETPEQRQARAAKLLFSVQFARPSPCSPNVAAALPALRRRALEHTQDLEAADELVEYTLQVALRCTEAAPSGSAVADWLMLLLEMSARRDQSFRSRTADQPPGIVQTASESS